MTVRSTYALDSATVQELAGMARRMGVSKSEALRRAIHGASRGAMASNADAVRVLDQLQRSLRLSRGGADAWIREQRAERRAASARRDRGR